MQSLKTSVVFLVLAATEDRTSWHMTSNLIHIWHLTPNWFDTWHLIFDSHIKISHQVCTTVPFQRNPTSTPGSGAPHPVSHLSCQIFFFPITEIPKKIMRTNWVFGLIKPEMIWDGSSSFDLFFFLSGRSDLSHFLLDSRCPAVASFGNPNGRPPLPRCPGTRTAGFWDKTARSKRSWWFVDESRFQGCSFQWFCFTSVSAKVVCFFQHIASNSSLGHGKATVADCLSGQMKRVWCFCGAAPPWFFAGWYSWWFKHPACFNRRLDGAKTL